MKTKWGSCNHKARTIRVNTELAKKPPECLEYIVVHELVHSMEPTHNARFLALMDEFMPKWHCYRDVLKDGSSGTYRIVLRYQMGAAVTPTRASYPRRPAHRCDGSDGTSFPPSLVGNRRVD